jgi:hypothetical protein
MEMQSPPRAAKPVEAPPARTVGFAASGDTLTTVDRLEIPHTQPLASTRQIFSPEPIAPPAQSPAAATAVAAVAPASAPIVEQPARTPPAGKPAIVLPKPRPKDIPKASPKHQVAKATAKTTRSKPIVEAKSCEPGAFDGLFKALSLPVGCQT